MTLRWHNLTKLGNITMGRFRFHVVSVFLLAIIGVAATAGVSAASTPSNAGASVTPARSAGPAGTALRRDGRAPAATAVVRPTTLRRDGRAPADTPVPGATATAGTATVVAKVAPTLSTALSPPTVAYGSDAVDTATVTGTTARGAPTGYVTFSACGPTATATVCTSPNLGPVSVELSPTTNKSSTTSVTIDPGSPGWYCFLDTYSGDGNYTSATDNSVSTECLDVTSTAPAKVTPGFSTALSPPTVAYGSDAVDTASVKGTTADGAPTGYVTFSACGPTASATACASPNVGPASVELSPVSATSSTASVTIDPGSPGWYCFLDTYSGDSHYTSATDNSVSTECLDVTSTPPAKVTPSFSTAVSPPTVAYGQNAVDNATVTGTTTDGAPTGYVTFTACGPSASATACTSPNLGPATGSLSPVSATSSTASVTLDPTGPGWYCFLDTYSGDSHYTSATDNSVSTECLDVTSTPPVKVTPGFSTALSPPTVVYGQNAVDIATVTGTTADGAPTGYVTFSACGPTASATACTSPNLGPVSVELSPVSATSSTASVTIDPGGPGWYCFLDTYSGDGNYTSATDNSVSTECLDVTGTSASVRSKETTRRVSGGRRGATATTLAARPPA